MTEVAFHFAKTMELAKWVEPLMTGRTGMENETETDHGDAAFSPSKPGLRYVLLQTCKVTINPGQLSGTNQHRACDSAPPRFIWVTTGGRLAIWKFIPMLPLLVGGLKF